MDFFDNLITHERDLLFGLLSSLDIHTQPLIFAIWRVAGWQHSIRRPTFPEDDDRNFVDKHCDDDNDDEDENHHGAWTEQDDRDFVDEHRDDNNDDGDEDHHGACPEDDNSNFVEEHGDDNNDDHG